MKINLDHLPSQSMPTTSPLLWLRFSLQSFHSVVLEEPVYWLVALAARACLRNFLFEKQLLPESRTGNPLLYREWWREESLKEVAWTQRLVLCLLSSLCVSLCVCSASIKLKLVGTH